MGHSFSGATIAFHAALLAFGLIIAVLVLMLVNRHKRERFVSDLIARYGSCTLPGLQGLERGAGKA